MSRPRLTTPRAIVLAAAFVAVGLLGGGVALGGGQEFTDVGPTHPFFDEIEEFGGAGISGGFPDGTYRPGTAVSRGAMAAFMTRGLTSVNSASGTNAITVDGEELLNTVNFEVPGESGGGQHLIIEASVTWRTTVDLKSDACSNATTQQCEFNIGVYNNGALVPGSVVTGRVVSGNDGGVISVHAVITNQPTGIERTITLRATPETNLLDDVLQLDERQMVVTSAPFLAG
jgi:hypothetical protein